MAEQTNIQKPQAPAPKTAAAKPVKSSGGIKSAFVIICICFVLALLTFWAIYKFFTVDGEPKNLIGTIYKGGVVVPVLITCLYTVIALAIERWIALSKAKGSGNTTKFVENVKVALHAKDLNKAEELCRKQKGTVGAVVYATLQKYKEMERDTVLEKEQKLAAIQQTLEEATALEMPMLQQNLPVLATLTTLGTLLGLFGTVLGMIKSFGALGAEGSADANALSKGISEALINTATGILTAALALIAYNYYTNKIDNMTYAIDELGFSIVSTFAATH